MSQMRYNPGEVITAMVTPFTQDLKVDYKAAEKLAKHLINNGSDSILVAGTTGESPTLTHEEEYELFAIIKSAISGKGKLILGAGSNSTLTAIESSKKAKEIGADAILSVVPYYNKPSQKGMIAHFSQIAEAVDLPIMLYNIPGRSVVNMLPSTIAELANKYENIFAVKQSNADLDQVTEIMSLIPEGFSLYSGDDSLTLPMLSLGATGVVSVSSHLIGNEMKQMITKFKSGDVCGANQIHQKCYPLFKQLFMAPNPVPTKTALAEKGIIPSASVRQPLVELSSEEKAELSKITSKY